MQVTPEIVKASTSVRKTMVNNYQGSVIRPVVLLDGTLTDCTDDLPEQAGYNAPPLPLASDASIGVFVWIRPEATTHICVYPVLRDSSVDGKTGSAHVYFVKDGIAPNGVPFLRGTFGGLMEFTAGATLLPDTDPYYDSTYQTTHATTLTYTDNGECVATPQVFGGTAGSVGRKGIIFDVQSAPYLVIVGKVGTARAIGFEIEEL